MTSIDPKGLQAAREAVSAIEGSWLWGEAEKAVTAYLSASTTPSGEVQGLETVAWAQKWSDQPGNQYLFFQSDPSSTHDPAEPLVRLSQASAEIDRLSQANAALMAERTIIIETKREQLEAQHRQHVADLALARGEVSDLEARLAQAEEVLRPFAEAGSMALISGRPPGEHVDANHFLSAAAFLKDQSL